MAFATRAGRSRRLLLVLVLLSVTVLTFDARNSSAVDSLRESATDALAPVKDAAQGVFQPVEDVWNGVFNYGEVADENAALRERVAELEAKEIELAERERRVAEVEDLVDLPFASDLPAVTAELVGPPPSNFDQSVQLDRGASSGIEVGMPVVSAGGLIGRITRTSDQRSYVRLLTDPSLKVGVRLPASPELGFTRGRGAGRDLEILLIEGDAIVEVGDPVVTSGQEESLFPRGIPVATVSEVVERDGDLDLEIRATPTAGIDGVSVVKVLLYTPPR